MSVFQLIYISKPSAADSETVHEVLSQISGVSHLQNAVREITGLLLYGNGHFMQLLEGDEPMVRALFESIQRDGRHHDVQELTARHVDERAYPSWNMGVYNLETEGPNTVAARVREHLEAAPDSEEWTRRVVLAFEELRDECAGEAA